MSCSPRVHLNLFKQLLFPVVRFPEFSTKTDLRKTSEPKRKDVNFIANGSDGFPEKMQKLYQKKLLQYDERLNDAAKKFYTVSLKTRQYRNHILHSIKNAVVGKSDRSVFTVGSSGSGLAGQTSDIDLVVFTSKDTELRKRNSKALSSKHIFRKYMLGLADLVEKQCSKDFDRQNANILANARVPILVLQTKGNLKVEIQLNSENCLRNTLFLRNIVSKDPRVAVLIFWAKEWLRTLKLKNSRLGLFSSYHTALLVVHFLQGRIIQFSEEDLTCDLSPCTPIERVISRLSTSQPPVIEINRNLQPSATELMLHFLDYYSKLDLHKVTIHAGNSSLTERTDEEQEDILWITDPFSDSTVCHVKDGADKFAEAVAFTKRSMLAGKGLNWPMKFS